MSVTCNCGQPAIDRFGRCRPCWIAHIAALVEEPAGERSRCPDCGTPVASSGRRCRSCGQRRRHASEPAGRSLSENFDNDAPRRIEPDDPPPKPIRFAPRCIAPGCTAPRYLRQLCSVHYHRALRDEVADNPVPIAA